MTNVSQQDLENAIYHDLKYYPRAHLLPVDGFRENMVGKVVDYVIRTHPGPTTRTVLPP